MEPAQAEEPKKEEKKEKKSRFGMKKKDEKKEEDTSDNDEQDLEENDDEDTAGKKDFMAEIKKISKDDFHSQSDSGKQKFCYKMIQFHMNF